MNSLTVRRGLRRMRTFLVYGFGVVALVALALGLFLPGRPWMSALVALVAAGLMFGLSWFTTASMAQSEDPSVAWVALDYVGKAALTVGVLLLAKYGVGLEVVPVAVVMVAAILVTAGVMVAAFAPTMKSGSIRRETDD